jgi:hypothetical protein
MGGKSKIVERQSETLDHLIHILKNEGLEGVTFAKISKRMDVNKSLVAPLRTPGNSCPPVKLKRPRRCRWKRPSR